jgi:hypothetical protein
MVTTPLPTLCTTDNSEKSIADRIITASAAIDADMIMILIMEAAFIDGQGNPNTFTGSIEGKILL